MSYILCAQCVLMFFFKSKKRLETNLYRPNQSLDRGCWMWLWNCRDNFPILIYSCVAKTNWGSPARPRLCSQSVNRATCSSVRLWRQPPTVPASTRLAASITHKDEYAGWNNRNKKWPWTGAIMSHTNRSRSFGCLFLLADIRHVILKKKIKNSRFRK